MHDDSPNAPSATAVGFQAGLVTSAIGMSAHALSERVQAELVSRDMTWSALQRSARVSQKTIRALKEADPHRQWGHTTLSKFDAALGFPKGTLYGVWEAQPRGAGEAPLDEIAEQIRMLQAKIGDFEQRPPWAREVIEAMLPLGAEDRAVVISVALRLGARLR